MNIVFLLQKWMQKTEASTATEYAILVGGIAIALIVVIFLMGDNLTSIISTLGDSASNANSRMETP